MTLEPDTPPKVKRVSQELIHGRSLWTITFIPRRQTTKAIGRCSPGVVLSRSATMQHFQEVGTSPARSMAVHSNAKPCHQRLVGGIALQPPTTFQAQHLAHHGLCHTTKFICKSSRPTSPPPGLGLKDLIRVVLEKSGVDGASLPAASPLSNSLLQDVARVEGDGACRSCTL